MTSTAEIGNLRVRLGIDSAEFANGVRAVQGQLSTLGNSLKAFAGGAAAITLFNSAVTALHNVADMGDVAEAIGLSAEQLQVFNRMALASGTSTDIMARGLQSIAEQSVDASSKLAQLFNANGMVLAGKEMNQVILEFMTLLKNAKTPAEQLAMATGVLGDKVGRQLVESLRSGASGWNEAFTSMVNDGWYLSNEQVKAAQAIETRYNELLARLSTAWQSFAITVADVINTAVNPPMGTNGSRAQYGLGAINGTRFGSGGAPLPAPASTPTGFGGPGQFAYPPVQQQPAVPTANPFNGIKAPTASTATSVPIVPAVPKETIDSIYGAGEAFSEMYARMSEGIPETNLFSEALASLSSTISDSLGYAIEGLISGTMSLKDAFKSMVSSISQQLSQLAAQLIKSSIMRVLSMFAGSMGGFTVGGMSFGGFYADGGNLGSGKWGIAGEAGPEIVTGPASITPLSKIGSSAPQMNVTVINNSSSKVRTEKSPEGALRVFIEEAMADLVIRGGNKVDAALARGYGLRRAGR